MRSMMTEDCAVDEGRRHAVPAGASRHPTRRPAGCGGGEHRVDETAFRMSTATSTQGRAHPHVLQEGEDTMDFSAIFLPELMGTAMLTLLGGGVVANVLLAKTKGSAVGAYWLLINIGWGLAVFAGVYVAFSTGAHINPAVTVGLWATGDPLFPGNEDLGLPAIEATIGNVGVYFLAQILGGFLGAILVYLAYKRHYDEEAPAALKLQTFATKPEIRTKPWNLVTEAIGTFVLVFVIVAFGYTPTGLGPLAVG